MDSFMMDAFMMDTTNSDFFRPQHAIARHSAHNGTSNERSPHTHTPTQNEIKFGEIHFFIPKSRPEKQKEKRQKKKKKNFTHLHTEWNEMEHRHFGLLLANFIATIKWPRPHALWNIFINCEWLQKRKEFLARSSWSISRDADNNQKRTKWNSVGACVCVRAKCEMDQDTSRKWMKSATWPNYVCRERWEKNMGVEKRMKKPKIWESIDYLERVPRNICARIMDSTETFRIFFPFFFIFFFLLDIRPVCWCSFRHSQPKIHNKKNIKIEFWAINSLEIRG